MAFHLQNIYGTEQDRVNCPFYFKIGACTYGERCSRLHNKPTESQTLVMINHYVSPYNSYGPNSEPLFDLRLAQEHLDDYYEDVFLEMAGFGEIEEIYVCRNLGDHLMGNCYIKYYEEEDAAKALMGLRGRYYGGRSINAELSPVTDFREARCRQYDVGECNRGGYCNFMHLCEPSRDLHKTLFAWQRKVHTRKRWEAKKAAQEARGDVKSESRRDRSRSRDDGDRDRDRERRDRRERSRDRSRDRKDRDRSRERRHRHRDRSRERSHERDSKRRRRDDERRERSRERPDTVKEEQQYPQEYQQQQQPPQPYQDGGYQQQQQQQQYAPDAYNQGYQQYAQQQQYPQEGYNQQYQYPQGGYPQQFPQ